MRYCAGIDIGGTTVKAGLYREDGVLLSRTVFPARASGRGKRLIADIAEAVRKLLAEAGLPSAALAGVGAAFPCPVRADGYIARITNLDASDFYPAKLLSEALSVPAAVLNDANAAAEGERWLGAGRGSEDFCLVTLGTGIGCGIVSGGRLLTGFRGAAGEFGHLHVNDEETEVCGCGSRGCLEQYASATGMVRMAKRLLAESGEESGLRGFGEALSAKDICDLARGGDRIAVRTLDLSMEYLGRGLAELCVITDPELILIGGGVSAAGELLTGRLQRIVNKMTPILGEPKVRVLTSELGNDAGMAGAAGFLLNS